MDILSKTESFYIQFPWVFSYPPQPLCSECLYESFYQFVGDGLQLHETHADRCSRYAEHDGKVHVVERH